MKNLLIEDGSTLSAIKAKLIPTLNFFEKRKNNNPQTWKQLIEKSPKTIVFLLDGRSGVFSKKIFDILIASLYNYHTKHRAEKLFIFIDEVKYRNLCENGIINQIFTKGRKHKLCLITATQSFKISRQEEWETLNNARTKIFFRPHINSIDAVMTALNLPQSERRIFSEMQEGDCFISSELYSKKTCSNRSAIVRGKVPENYTPLKDILPPLPNYTEESEK